MNRGRSQSRTIPQLANPNEVADRTLLPSFLYVPGEVDFPAGSLGLPWDDAPKFVIGELARKRGAENPIAAGCIREVVAVARAPSIAPQRSCRGRRRRRLSRSRRWKLRRNICNTCARRGTRGTRATASGSCSGQQDVLLTVPASFDEEARELTLRAAEQAGLERDASGRAAGGVLCVARKPG